MRKFGFIRLYREDISPFHKLYFKIWGVCSDHKLRFLYLKSFLNEHLKADPAGRILDAGCGTGDYAFYFAERYPQSEVLGTDVRQDLIEQNNLLNDKVGLTNLAFSREDLTNIDENGTFDFISCIDVLEHISDQKKALQRLHRALAPGGRLFVHIPLERARPVIFDKYLGRFHDWTDHEHIAEPHSRESFLEVLTECSFEIVKAHNSFNHYLGEFAVSIIMLFYENTPFNRIMLSLLTPLLCILTYLDVALKNKSGNGLAVMAAKSRPPKTDCL